MRRFVSISSRFSGRLAFPRRLYSSNPPAVDGVSFKEVERPASRQKEHSSGSELKELLKKHNLPTHGSREEQIYRLQEAGVHETQLPESAWEYAWDAPDLISTADLREELEELGLSTHGSREEMIRRLAKYDEEKDIVDEGWFEFFDKLSDSKITSELKVRQLPVEGTRGERVKRLSEDVEKEERKETENILVAEYTNEEMRRELQNLNLSVDGSKQDLAHRLANALDDMERQTVKSAVDMDSPRALKRDKAIQARKVQTYLDENMHPARAFRDYSPNNVFPLEDNAVDRVDRLSEQPRNPRNLEHFHEQAPTIQLEPQLEKNILEQGFADYSIALASFFKHCVQPESLGSRWIDTSMSLDGKFMKTKDLKKGKFHWTDESYTYGLIVLKVSEKSLGNFHSKGQDFRNQEKEVVEKNCIIIDLNKRRLYCLQIKASKREAEPEFGHDHAVYELNSNWVTEFKKVKWPENYNEPSIHWLFPVNEGPIEDVVIKNYPLHFNQATKYT